MYHMSKLSSMSRKDWFSLGLRCPRVRSANGAPYLSHRKRVVWIRWTFSYGQSFKHTILPWFYYLLLSLLHPATGGIYQGTCTPSYTTAIYSFPVSVFFIIIIIMQAQFLVSLLERLIKCVPKFPLSSIELVIDVLGSRSNVHCEGFISLTWAVKRACMG